MSGRIFDELQKSFLPSNLDVRGENAHAVAVKFLTKLQTQVPEKDERKKLMSAWIRSIRDNDYKIFRRALRGYQKRRDEE